MPARLLAAFVAVAAALTILAGCASNGTVPSPEPVTHVDETAPSTGGPLFNGN